jgi:hypothetical protein
MSDQMPSASADSPIVIRTSARVAWVFVVLAAVVAFALVRGYLDAATIGSRVEPVVILGPFIVFAVWAALYMVRHRSTLSISADEIILARRASPPRLVLDRSSGHDLKMITVTSGYNLKYATGLAIYGGSTTLPIRTFDANLVMDACLARGWRFRA